MYLASHSINNMATILRQSKQISHLRALCSLSRSLLVIDQQSPVDYRPLYSVQREKSFSQQIQNVSNKYQTNRYATTSSGFFAPSTMASNHRASSELHGNLNVFEDSDHLPSLPVPQLNDTLEKLKETISPIAMNSAEFVQTLQLIDEFTKSAGPKLDLLLRNKASQVKNWMSHDWWTEHVYLRSRKPLVINSNPGMVYPTLPFEINNQRALVNLTSQLISGIIDFKLALIHGYNPEATNSDNENQLDPNICYHQYQSIFGSTRVPGEHIDSQRAKSLTNNLENVPFNLVVSYKGRFFEIQLQNIEDENNRIETLTGILDKIIVSINNQQSGGAATSAAATADGPDCNLSGAGVLTAADRDKWAKAFKLLDADSMNSIQEAQFVVCIDTIPTDEDKFPTSMLDHPVGSEQHMAALSRQILHADQANVGNRWFDKAIQLIVVADENAERFLGAGINYEHTFREGTLVTKIIEYSYDKAVQKTRNSLATATSDNFFAPHQVASNEPAVFRQLPMFDTTNLKAVAEYLDQAKQDFISQIGQFDMSYFKYKNYGRNSIKSWHFSPDSWFQVALQLAYYNVHKRLGPCYESASTRRFAYGRTETIRSLTKEVAQFCYEPRLDTMQSAIQSHKAFALDAVNSNAIDRPLMGYRMLFNELKTNSWSWGLPTSHDGYNAHELLKLNNKSKAASGETISNGKIQEFNLEDIFSEEELTTISAFFNSELINRSFRFALSTSQVPSMHPNICMSYGPLLADGYGCCYNITGQQIVASITANSSNQSFSCEVDKLSDGLKRSLDTMKDIVEEQRSKSS